MASSLLIGLVMAACSPSQPAATIPAAMRATNSIILVKSPTPSATSTQFETPTPRSSPSVTLSPSPSPTPTHTRLPPTLTPTAFACPGQSGRIETGSLTLEYLSYPLNFRIYLPPCYDEQPERRYPVLYLIHGQFYTDDQWVRLGVPETCDALVANKELAPFLIVMPRDQAWKQPSVDRFGQALIEALLPWVEAHYRTLPDREYRAIGGISRGAAWAVHLGLSQWKLFGAVGAHSLPVFWEDVPEIGRWIDQIPFESLPRLFLDVGDHDRPEVLESASWFERLLTDKGIPHEWHMFSGEHEETYWFSHVEQYLRWYAADW